MMIMHQPPPDAADVAPPINVNGVQLQVVANFTYLGSTLSRTTKIDDGVAPGSPKPANPSAVCKTRSGIATVSTSTPN
ncbi:hypothetical protein SprV_0100030300 [Sparganum proliferum]